MRNNRGGDKKNPIIGREDDIDKILFTAKLFKKAGRNVVQIALATQDVTKKIVYTNMPLELLAKTNQGALNAGTPELIEWVKKTRLDQFIGEFYRRPIFIAASV